MKHPVYSQIFSMGNAWRCYFWTHSTLLWLLWIGSSASSTVFWHSPGNNSQTKLRRAGLETPEHMLVMLPSRLACEKTRHGDVTGSRVVIAHTGAYWTSCQVQSEWSTIPAVMQQPSVNQTNSCSWIMRSETNRRRRSGFELRHWWCRLEHRMWSTTTGWFACRVRRGHCRDCRAASCRKCWAFSCSSEPATAVKIVKHWQRSEDMAAKKVKCCRCWNNPKELGGQLCLRQEVNVSALMHRSQKPGSWSWCWTWPALRIPSPTLGLWQNDDLAVQSWLQLQLSRILEAQGLPNTKITNKKFNPIKNQAFWFSTIFTINILVKYNIQEYFYRFSWHFGFSKLK